MNKATVVRLMEQAEVPEETRNAFVKRIENADKGELERIAVELRRKLGGGFQHKRQSISGVK